MTAASTVPLSPLDAIDAALAERLLAAALSSGGDYADLYFEYRAGADYVLEEGRVRTVGRGVTLGLGVRVLRGDATGYAYTEELDGSAMTRGGAHRGADRRRRRDAGAGRRRGRCRCRLLPGRSSRRSRARASTSSRCCGGRTRRRAPTTRASSRSRRRSPRSGARSWSSPPTASWRATPAADALRRARRRRGRAASGRAGRAAAAGRFGMEYFDAPGPEPGGARARGGAPGDRACWTPSRRPPARWRWCSGRATPGILLHEAVGHGLEADFNRKGTSNYTGQIGKQVASRAVHRRRRRHHRQRARRRSTSTTRATPAQRNVLIENGILRRLHAGPALGASTSASSRRATAAARASGTSRCRA